MAKQSLRLQRGTVYQKEDGGNFFFRYTLNGDRKAVSLKTKNLKEAKKAAEKLLPVIAAPSLEVVAAHVKHVKFDVTQKTLRLADAWETYSRHPDRATPATVSEQEAYRITWREFLEFVDDDALLLDDITADVAAQYADHMRTREIAVDTHNRKIRRLRKVFATLREYASGENPFSSRSLMRKNREEQNGLRRMSFTKEQEQELLAALADKKHKLKNKPEIRALYYLGMFTGQRLKDCALLQWDRINFGRRRIWVKQFKTGSEVTLPIAGELLEVLHEAKAWRRNEYVLPAVADRYNTVDKNGKNIGSNLLNIDVLRPIRWIGLETSVKVPGRKKKVTIYGFHSLRHSFASHCAEANVPKAVAQSILGAASDIIDKYYVHIGEEAQQKAIDAISFACNADLLSPQKRIDQALTVIAGMADSSPELAQIESILRGDTASHGPVGTDADQEERAQ